MLGYASSFPAKGLTSRHPASACRGEQQLVSQSDSYVHGVAIEARSRARRGRIPRGAPRAAETHRLVVLPGKFAEAKGADEQLGVAKHVHVVVSPNPVGSGDPEVRMGGL